MTQHHPHTESEMNPRNPDISQEAARSDSSPERAPITLDHLAVGHGIGLPDGVSQVEIDAWHYASHENVAPRHLHGIVERSHWAPVTRVQP